MAFSRYLFMLNRANHNSIQSTEASLTDDRAFVSVFTHPLSNIERAIPEIRCTPLKKTWESQNIFHWEFRNSPKLLIVFSTKNENSQFLLFLTFYCF